MSEEKLNSDFCYINIEETEKTNDIIETKSIKTILLEKIQELEKILIDEDKSDDLIISYLLLNENHKINNLFEFEEIWELIIKISESWNTKNLLDMDTPVSKEDLRDFWKDTQNGKKSENEKEELETNFCDKLDICSIKPIIKIIFESIIYGYKKIIELF